MCTRVNIVDDINKNKDVTPDIMINLVIEVSKYMCSALYSFTLEELRTVNPSFKDVAKYCRLIIVALSSDNHDRQASCVFDVMKLMEESAEAVIDNDDKQITDCAVHLQETIEILKKTGGQINEK